MTNEQTKRTTERPNNKWQHSLKFVSGKQQKGTRINSTRTNNKANEERCPLSNVSREGTEGGERESWNGTGKKNETMRLNGSREKSHINEPNE